MLRCPAIIWFEMPKTGEKLDSLPLTSHVHSWLKPALWTFLLAAAALIIGVLVWAGFTAGGNPNPTAPDTSATAAVLNIGVLVFREGLECILVLTAVTASLAGKKQAHRRLHPFPGR